MFERVQFGFQGPGELALPVRDNMHAKTIGLRNWISYVCWPAGSSSQLQLCGDEEHAFIIDGFGLIF